MKTSEDFIYDSTQRGSVALEELRGIVQYRDLIYQLVRRDVVSRYKRSVLGIAWTMLQTLGMMIILSLVFSTLFHGIRRIYGLHLKWFNRLDIFLSNHQRHDYSDRMGRGIASENICPADFFCGFCNWYWVS